MAVDTLKTGAEAEAVVAADRPLGYMKQLDGVRALAVAAVLIHHFAPHGDPSPWLPWGVLHFMPWGTLGVRLFFVLSGFLITSILLDCRQLAQASGERQLPVEGKNRELTLPARLLGRFYIRRFLRIFPVYYLTLFVAAALDVANVRATFWVHACYVSNWDFALHGAYAPVFHFWSLAVEEQFYLVWPWLMLFLPQAWLVRFLVGTIVAAPLLRLTLASQDLPWLSIAWITPSCLDTLGMGALLAVVMRYPLPDLDHRRLARIALWLGIVPFLVLMPLTLGDAPKPIALVFGDTAMALVFVWLVDRAAFGFGGVAGRFLECAPLVYLGRISYGVYVFHNFMPGSLAAICRWLDWPMPANPLLGFALVVAATLLLASLSWYCFEKPINDLKRWFPYQDRMPRAQAPMTKE